MKLNQLLAQLNKKTVLGDSGDVEIKGIVYDPLRVEPGFLYVAINIYTQLDKIELPDGHPFVADAVANGAVAILAQKDVDVPPNVVKITVPDSRETLSILANHFYNYPSRNIKLLGVTGTNGKTTTTHIIESIFDQHYTVGLMGTLYFKIDGNIFHSKDTTPEPPDLQAIFSDMNQQGCDYCALEASSHGIDFHRLDGLDFEVGIFTNLSPDHLDYHKTMDNYRKTKLRFFNWLAEDKFAIVNVDDPYAKDFLAATVAQKLTTGIERPADVTAKNIRYSLNGTQYDLVTPAGTTSIRSKLVGRYNVYNTLSAVAAAVSQGIGLEDIKKGIERPILVAGRFEMVDCGQDFAMVVDYAHTPDSMENILSLAKSLNPSRIITVFGCGGDRDPKKRPQMGEIAAKYSDIAIITSDNPRNEDPMQIINHILAGMPETPGEVIVDREAAIQRAAEVAQIGDLVLILGKGHEKTQIIKNKTIPFSDREVAEKAISRVLIP